MFLLNWGFDLVSEIFYFLEMLFSIMSENRGDLGESRENEKREEKREKGIELGKIKECK